MTILETNQKINNLLLTAKKPETVIKEFLNVEIKISDNRNFNYLNIFYNYLIYFLIKYFFRYFDLQQGTKILHIDTKNAQIYNFICEMIIRITEMKFNINNNIVKKAPANWLSYEIISNLIVRNLINKEKTNNFLNKNVIYLNYQKFENKKTIYGRNALYYQREFIENEIFKNGNINLILSINQNKMIFSAKNNNSIYKYFQLEDELDKFIKEQNKLNFQER